MPVRAGLLADTSRIIFKGCRLDKTSKISFKRNILIMTLPVLLFAIPIMILLGESAFLFLNPLSLSFIFIAVLAKKLNTRDAIAYPIVQYSFFVLLFYLLWEYSNVGLGLIVVIPMLFIINFALVFLYFNFVKNKKLRGKILILLSTLLITLTLYSEHYGAYASTPIIIRLWDNLLGQ